MRTPENVILSALGNGGRIKSFYRRAVQGPQSAKTQLADGYVLDLHGERGEVILSHADFLSVKTKLVETEAWEQVVGNTRFGGSTWVLQHESDD
ncbi:hypothetical protein [Serratia marcescens]|uniref:hypothetical protein n=1 Tax=Serratia marcescens TaxID=615 RepID=UPI0002B863FD|nr:hypothetical protein [Serratia marcescens]EMF04223.1 hypothetical protein F518_18323 [Serratia marcescens VGH107]